MVKTKQVELDQAQTDEVESCAAFLTRTAELLCEQAREELTLPAEAIDHAVELSRLVLNRIEELFRQANEPEPEPKPPEPEPVEASALEAPEHELRAR